MSRIYRPREREVTTQQQYPPADLLREVREIERRRILLDMRDAIDRIQATDNDRVSYANDRTGRDVKKDVLAALRRLEVEND